MAAEEVSKLKYNVRTENIRLPHNQNMEDLNTLLPGYPLNLLKNSVSREWELLINVICPDFSFLEYIFIVKNSYAYQENIFRT